MIARPVASPAARNTLIALVDEQSGQRVMSCYQCGKCTAGCPVATIDVGPRQVMRAVQMGSRELALGNQLIWFCLSCQTCSARCPRLIDVAAVMETLRLLAVAERVEPAAPEMALFHRIFLGSVKTGGRIYELGLGAAFNLLSRRPLSNVGLVSRLFAKRKIGLLPDRVAVDSVREIYGRVAARDGRPVATVGEAGSATKAAVAAVAIGVGAMASVRALRRDAARSK